MNTGSLYNAFVGFVIGGVGATTFLLLRRLRRKKEIRYSQFLDFFLLSLGATWFFIGFRNFIVWRGLLELNRFLFNWITGPLTYIHLIPGLYYFSWSFFREKRIIRLLFNSLFTCLAAATVFTFYKYGFEMGEMTYWGINPVPNEATNNLLSCGIFVPSFFCIIIEIIRRYKRWKRTGKDSEKQLFGFSIGFLIYALTGIFDAVGGSQGWLTLLVRTGIMTAPLIFYLSATLELRR